MERIVIVGATSVIAEHCARLWVIKPCRVVLVGRNPGRLAAVAADLRLRSPSSDISWECCDFLDPAAIQGTVGRAHAHLGGVDIALIAHGALMHQQDCQADITLAATSLQINGHSPALFAEAFAGHLAAAGSGTLAVISSVAGDRGRKSNYIYGAAKGLIHRYVQGLQHRFAGTDVSVVCIKPGPTATPMTAGMKGMRLADPQAVAAAIVAGIGRGARVVYAPARWRLIMLVLVHLPWFLFRRMDL